MRSVVSLRKIADYEVHTQPVCGTGAMATKMTPYHGMLTRFESVGALQRDPQ